MLNDYYQFTRALTERGLIAPLPSRLIKEFVPAEIPAAVRSLLWLLLVCNQHGDASLDLSAPEKLPQKLSSRLARFAVIGDDRSIRVGEMNFAAELADLPAAVDLLAPANKEVGELVYFADDRFSATAPLETAGKVFVFDQVNRRLYTQKNFLAAQIVFQRARHFFSTAGKPNTKKENFTHCFNENFQPHPDQLSAIERGWNRESLIITGGAGTGKTTVVKYILQPLLENGLVAASEILAAAPSGKAAARLEETLITLGLPAQTIHRMLGWNSRGFRYSADFPLPGKILIIDESGMMALDLFAALLSALPPTMQLLLLGDEQQLAAVSSGAVLSDLLRDFPAANTRLSFSHRAAGKVFSFGAAVANGDISSGEKLWVINDCDFNWREIFQKEVYRFEPPIDSPNARRATPNFLGKIVRAWTREHYQNSTARAVVKTIATAERDAVVVGDFSKRIAMPEGELQKIDAYVNRARILGLTRFGDTGVENLNTGALRALANKKLSATETVPIIDGSLLMITRNLPEFSLFNGNIGIIIGANVAFRRAVGLEFFPRSAFNAADWDDALAMTVHKAQGSEFDHVLLVLPPRANHPLLTREILYTGITRAKKSCGIFGTLPAFTAGVSAFIARH